MGQILDFVPNHMGIGEPLNQWWMDVLENGPSSIYAPYFDIDWEPLKSDLHDKVLLPILGDQYGRVLERGELQVHFEAGSFYLNYYDHEWPIAPGTYRHVLQIALENLAAHKDEDFYAEFQSIITALEYLPRRNETDPARIAERGREKEIIKRRLDRRCAEAPQVREAIAKAVLEINGTPGDSRSFDALDRLLDDQAYRLAFWRVAAEEINYRRFFDINDLAAIRMELPEVFDATHRAPSRTSSPAARSPACASIIRTVFICRRSISKKLQQRCAEALGTSAAGRIGRAIYLAGRKNSLRAARRLPNDWPVHGTTGYDFCRIGEQPSLSTRQRGTGDHENIPRFVGHSMHFGHLVYAKKRLVMRISLANDVNVLGNMLDRLSEQNRWFRDFTLDALASRGARDDRVFPGLSDLCHARRAGERGRPRGDRTRRCRSQTAQSRDRRIGLQFPARYSALSFSRKPRRGSARRARPFRSEVPAMHRPDHGEGTRRHRFLHLTTGWRR